jgi:hypothetical protein
MLECEKYQRERTQMMNVVIMEMGGTENRIYNRTAWQWMIFMLGINGRANDRVIEAVKEFLVHAWKMRGDGDNQREVGREGQP